MVFEALPRSPLDFSTKNFILVAVKKWPLLVEPSLLSADFGKIADEAKRVEDAGADALHLDVMDGHFVPNLTFGPKVVEAVNRSTDLFLDVHLMIYQPFEYIERFVQAGADRITFQMEATEDVEETLKYIRKCNVEAGLAFCPETSHEMIPKYLDQCDLILIMTVHPGFGGQAFMPEMLEKIRFTRAAVDRRGIRAKGVVVKDHPEKVAPFNIQVDGGINDETAKECVEAGANVLVSGSYLYGDSDMKSHIQTLRGVGG